MEKEEQALPTVDRRKKQGQAVMCSCGARIPVDKVYCPRCGKRRPRAWKCQKCGQLTTNEGVACPVCGGKLSEIISSPADSPKRNRLIGFASIGIFAILLVAVVLFCTLGKGSREPNGALEQAIQERINEELFIDPMTEYENYNNIVVQSIQFNVVKDVKNGKATVKFTYIDLLALADTFGDRELSMEEYYEECTSLIGSGTAPVSEKKIELSCSQLPDGTYQIEDTPDLMEVLSGGTYYYLMNLIQGGGN